VTDLEQRAVAAYLGLAIGDALGATVEFMTPREIVVAYGRHDHIRGGGWLHLKPGQVTDDTTMSLALGESILAQGGVEAQSVAQAFDGWMRSKPVDIGNTVRRGIVEFRRTGRTEVPLNEFDGGNGAAMRVLPVALATFGADPATIRQAALVQARITHHNPLSDAGTLCVNAMVQLALSGTDRGALRQGPVADLLAEQPRFAYEGKPQENPTGFIVDTLQAVFQGLFATDSFEACLVEVVNRGGDADTTGAIAGMIAGALYGLDAIPEAWRLALDGAVSERVVTQARALIALAGQH